MEKVHHTKMKSQLSYNEEQLQNLFNNIHNRMDDLFQRSSPNSLHLPLFPICKKSYEMSFLLLTEKFDEEKYEEKLTRVIEMAQQANDQASKLVQNNSKMLCAKCNKRDSVFVKGPDFLIEKLQKLKQKKEEVMNEIKTIEDQNKRIKNNDFKSSDISDDIFNFEPPELSGSQLEFERIQCEHMIEISNMKNQIDTVTEEISALEIHLAKASSITILRQPYINPNERDYSSPRWRKYQQQHQQQSYIQPSASNLKKVNLRNISLMPIDISSHSQPLSPPALIKPHISLNASASSGNTAIYSITPPSSPRNSIGFEPNPRLKRSPLVQ